jgi:truncated hemoglobin YjbI
VHKANVELVSLFGTLAVTRMTKSKEREEPDSEDAIMECMNEALKKMMCTPHETQREMVERWRRRQVQPKSKPTLKR